MNARLSDYEVSRIAIGARVDSTGDPTLHAQLLAKEVQESRTRIAALEADLEISQSFYESAHAAALAARTRVAALEAAIDAFVADVDEQHQPQWTSDAAKAAGKEPWVCFYCGTADGGWPCAERLALDALKEARHERPTE